MSRKVKVILTLELPSETVTTHPDDEWSIEEIKQEFVLAILDTKSTQMSNVLTWIKLYMVACDATELDQVHALE